MSDNTWWSTKVSPKLLSDLGMISMFSSDILLHFHKPIRVVTLKYLIYSLAGIKTVVIYLSWLWSLVTLF